MFEPRTERRDICFRERSLECIQHHTVCSVAYGMYVLHSKKDRSAHEGGNKAKRRTCHLPAVFHKFGYDLVEKLRRYTHESTGLWVVCIGLVELFKDAKERDAR